MGNNFNDHDGNDNLDLVHYYSNTHQSVDGIDTFIGNVVSFPKCSYVFNFAYDELTQIKTYNVERFTVSIEYDSTLKRKRTTNNQQYQTSFQKTKTYLSYYDFPCQNTEFYYHPGINAIMYLSDDMKYINVIADKNFPTNGDACATDLFADSSKIAMFKIDISTITAISTTYVSVLNNFVFLNNNLYIVTYNKNTVGSSQIDSRIWKVSISTSGTPPYTFD